MTVRDEGGRGGLNFPKNSMTSYLNVPSVEKEADERKVFFMITKLLGSVSVVGISYLMYNNMLKKRFSIKLELTLPD